MSILDRLTSHLKHVLGRACALAGASSDVTPLHLLLALALERGSVAEEILTRVHCTPDAIQMSAAMPELTDKTEEPINERTRTKRAARAIPLLSPNAKRALEKAALAAATHEHRYIGTEHLLAGILETEDTDVIALFAKRGLDPKVIHQHLDRIVYRSTSKFPELTAETPEPDTPPEPAVQTLGAHAGGDPSQKAAALEFFAKDLTSPTVTAHLDPVIGRDTEIERTIQILCRRTKNNPILLGEPGVGKTAIVEGLAKKIAERDVPDVLIGKRILALDLALLVAGTIYRGEFESRLKQILDEIRQDPNTILFIDEIHTIIGAGASSGSLDAANILKPALAKGEIRCIGATTYTEFKKHIENDAALERRFQPVHVAEPSADATREILRGLKPYYEEFHHVRIDDTAIDAAARFAERYLQDRRFPDKAIDLIDEAAARARVHAKNDPLLKRANMIGAALERAEETKRQAVTEERFEDALALREEHAKLLREAHDVQAQLRRRKTTKVGDITENDIAAVVAQIVDLSAEEILLTEHAQLLALGERLRERIIGQDDAIRTIAAALRRAKSGIGNQKRPVGSFLLLGPTGVGKTETARALADILFHHRDAFIRLDMSEFSEGFTISKLIGAPAGYVGYREGSKLTDAVRKHPASVVLFDEIEKAHPDVWNLLLQILEDGRITDATGREVNFMNAVIVLTSNIGTSAFTQAGIGFLGGTTTADALEDRFADIQSDALRELKNRFRPELLNRIDATIVYHPLGKPHLATIADRGIADFASRLLAQHRIALTADPAVATWVAERAFDPAQGARAVRRLLQENLENPIAQGILEEKFHAGGMITVGVNVDTHGLDIVAPARQRAHATRTKAIA